MKKNLTKIGLPISTLIFLGIFIQLIQPRLGTFFINCVVGLAFIVFGWQLNIKTNWFARIILLLGVLWLVYLFLYYVTGFNNPYF